MLSVPFLFLKLYFFHLNEGFQIVDSGLDFINGESGGQIYERGLALLFAEQDVVCGGVKLPADLGKGVLRQSLFSVFDFRKKIYGDVNGFGEFRLGVVMQKAQLPDSLTDFGFVENICHHGPP